jgi:hypothetical protein
VSSTAQTLPHGVHKVIVSTADMGYGRTSGLIGYYPSDDLYHTTGFIGGILGTVPGGNDIVRNRSGGVPAAGNSTQAPGGGTVTTSEGLHVCDKVFGARNTSGLVITSPFNGLPVFFNAISSENFGNNGALYSAYFTKQPPPGITYVWRQHYRTEAVRWRDMGSLIQAEGSTDAYGFTGSQWVFHSHSAQVIGTPPDPWTWHGQTAGLGQTDAYHFMKLDTTTRTVSHAQTNFDHISHNREYDMNGIAWSRNYGWFGTGGLSANGHRFESFRISGSPDGGSLIKSSAGSLEIQSPIGIGAYSFVRRGTDVRAGNRLYWTVQLGNSDDYNTAILNFFDVVVSGDLPFSTGDIVGTFIGHTIFVGANDEGITQGDWVVVSTNVGRFLCRVVVDTGAGELQLVECLFEITNTAVTPEIFISIS